MVSRFVLRSLEDDRFSDVRTCDVLSRGRVEGGPQCWTVRIWPAVPARTVGNQLPLDRVVLICKAKGESLDLLGQKPWPWQPVFVCMANNESLSSGPDFDWSELKVVLWADVALRPEELPN